MKADMQNLWDNLVFYYEQTEEFQLIILNNKKVEYMWDNNTSLLKFLHKNDIQYAKSNGRFIERIGACLAVKLAYNKIHPKTNLNDIFIQRDTRGAPTLWYQTYEIKHAVISLTHIPNYSGACLHKSNTF